MYVDFPYFYLQYICRYTGSEQYIKILSSEFQEGSRGGTNDWYCCTGGPADFCIGFEKGRHHKRSIKPFSAASAKFN
jgi:hypothetical protein